MSSSDAAHNESTPDGRGSAEPGSPDEETSTPSEAHPEPIECPNCGHEFTGNYCPKCGQEADPSASVVEVIGGFFRELFDVEHGFWPTFVGLTLRPGEVLRQYLSGVRAGLASPGRYLLAAVVVDVGIDRLYAWIGMASDPLSLSSGPSSPGNGGGKTVHGLGRMAGAEIAAIYEGPQTRIIGALLVTGLLALLLYRLFGDKIDRMGEGLAIGSFLVAHAVVLARGADLLYVSSASFYTGQPVDRPDLHTFAIFVGYVGVASYRGFGPGWRSAVKGVFAGAWSLVEALSVALICGFAYVTILALMYPEKYVPTDYPAVVLAMASVTLLTLCALPLLLHAGVEVYSRYR